MVKNSKRDNRKTQHHIIPQSRGGGNESENITYVPKRKHDAYHALFNNMIPEEILVFLGREFWDEKYEITIKQKSCNNNRRSNSNKK